jgi:RNA polymerase sigma-70 factor (ECF subfamily)
MLPPIPESFATDWIGTILLVIAFAEGVGDDPSQAEAIRNGDRKVFKRFFDTNHEEIYRYLRGRGLSAEVSSDAVQQAFIVLWEKRGAIKQGTSLRAYVFKIAYRRALNELRAQRHEGIDESLKRNAIPTNVLTTTSEQATDHILLMDKFQDTVDQLPERRRLVFELCFIHGYTYREAAAILEVSIKTVENQMGHALKALRAAFAAYRETGS